MPADMLFANVPFIAPFYAAILALLFVALSIRTLRLRRQLEIPLGDSADPEMIRAMRVHANFAEYAPLTLLLALMLEIQGASAALVHVLCLSLVAGRFAHAYGVSQAPENYSFRVFGMACTFSALAGAAICLLAAIAARFAA